jgi:hypothetical protein
MANYTLERLAKIPADPTEGLVYICETFFRQDDAFTQNQEQDYSQEEIKFYIEAYALLRAYNKVKGFRYNLEDAPSESSDHIQIAFIRNVFSSVQAEVNKVSKQKTAQSFEQFFESHLRGINQFELSDGDIEEIQKLINELRQKIKDAESLDEKYKLRILTRLEKLQTEIHKSQSSFDTLTGTMYEVLSVIQKAGEAATPWYKIVRGIMLIAWASQGRIYELPSSAPMNFLTDADKKD